MQKIWDATSCYEYEITTSAAVYQKVCDWLSSRMILKYMPDFSLPLRLLAQCYRICWHCGPLGILWYPRKLTKFRQRMYRVCEVLPWGSSFFVSSEWTWWQKGMCPLKLSLHMSNNNIILLRNGRGFFVAPSSSRLSLLTSWPLKAVQEFLIFMTNPLPLGWVG